MNDKIKKFNIEINIPGTPSSPPWVVGRKIMAFNEDEAITIAKIKIRREFGNVSMETKKAERVYS